MKKLLAFLLAAALLIGLLPLSALAEKFGRFNYELRDDKIWITGATSKIEGKLDVPDEINGLPVVGVGARAFAEMEGITAILLPDSLKWIESGAFSNCTGVVSAVAIPDSIEWIATGAFSGVPITGKEYSAAHRYALIDSQADFTAAGSLHDWETVTENGLVCWLRDGEAELVAVKQIFSTSLRLPTQVQGLPLTAVGPFAACGYVMRPTDFSFRHLAIPGCVQTVGAYAFQSDPLYSVFLEEGVRSVGTCAFTVSQDEGRRVTLPRSLTEIGANAIAYNYGQKKLTVYAYEDTPAYAAAEAQGCKVISRVNPDGAVLGCDCGYLYQSRPEGVRIYQALRECDGYVPEQIEGVPVTTVFADVLFTQYPPQPLGGVYVPPTVTQVVGTSDRTDGKTVFGVPGSYIETWCAANGVQFKSIYVRLGVPFEDTPEKKWYYEAVCFAYHTGLMAGISDTQFDPQGKVTRAMLVAVLWRLSGSPGAGEEAPADSAEPGPAAWTGTRDPAAADGFDDVKETDWFAPAVAWAAANGVVYGTSETTFSPNDPATREQIAAILYRYAGLTGMDVSVSKPVSGYPDAGQISPWAVDALCWARGAGVISGQLIGNDVWLKPLDTATRAEIASILMRLVVK